MADLSKNQARIEEIENEIDAAYTKIRELEAEAEKLLVPFPTFRDMQIARTRQFRVFRDTKRTFVPLGNEVVVEVPAGLSQNPKKNAVAVNSMYAGQLELFDSGKKVIPVG